MAKALEDRIIENAGSGLSLAMTSSLSPPVGASGDVRWDDDRRQPRRDADAREETAGRLLLPAKDVKLDLLQPTSYTSPHAGKGLASFYSVKVGDRVVEKAAWRYLQPERPDLKDYVAFYWDKTDAWFEEDDEVFVHPVIPFTGSMSSTARVTSRSSWAAKSSRRPPGRACCSRPACRPAITFRRSTCAWTC